MPEQAKINVGEKPLC